MVTLSNKRQGIMTQLHLYNSLTRKKEAFTPLDPAHIRLYACGPTVYNYAHIGNARMAVVFDLLARVLRQAYPSAKVTYVSNITDVDDKIIAASKETGEAIDVITRKYEAIYNDDMAALGVEKPNIQPRATDHIGEMIALIERLIERGHAYAADGHVLFNVPSFPAYGGLSGRSRDEQIAGSRVEVAPYKKDPADFVLWKPSTEDQPAWDSPWGRGRPGWHIECSAMAEKHLGLPFDIHGGGADLKFPHHENEIAQSCCAHGHENDLSAFAKFWVHNGFVTVEGEKMSKSLGNFRTAHDLLKEHNGETLRLALLSAHYRQPLDWSERLLHQANKLRERINSTLAFLQDIEAAEGNEAYPSVIHALYDDLNTPLAIAGFYDLVSEILHAPKNDLPSLKMKFCNTLDILGIQPVINSGSSEDAERIENLLQERQAARQAKNFARADEIRKELESQGIVIEDTPQGAKWRKV